MSDTSKPPVHNEELTRLKRCLCVINHGRPVRHCKECNGSGVNMIADRLGSEILRLRELAEEHLHWRMCYGGEGCVSLQREFERIDGQPIDAEGALLRWRATGPRITQAKRAKS